MYQIQLKMTNSLRLPFQVASPTLSLVFSLLHFRRKVLGVLTAIANMAEYEFSELSDNEAIKKEYRGYPGGLVRLKKGDWILKPATAELLPEYKSMEVRQSDVWIVTYPKVFLSTLRWLEGYWRSYLSPSVWDDLEPRADLASGTWC